jgi:hypothetical protein
MLSSLLILALVVSGCDFMQQALRMVPRDGIYLIPSGFVGAAIIVYDQPNGVVPDVEEGDFVYKLPVTGVLKVRTTAYVGIINLKYFYVDQAGERQEVKYITITGDHDPQGRPQNKYGNLSQDEVENSIFVMNPSGVGEFRVNGKTIQFSRIIVGKLKDSEQLFYEYQKKLVEVQQELTNTNGN